jgi:hypothetical protein
MGRPSGRPMPNRGIAVPDPLLDARKVAKLQLIEDQNFSGDQQELQTMKRFLLAGAVGALLLAVSTAAQAQQISGNYMESRNADVYTGFCVANGEVHLVGDQAILAWQVNKGSWDGVALDGLGVVGVVRAGATLGDVHSNPYPAKSVMIVDERASAQQRKALVSMAQAMSGQLLANVLRVDSAPITVAMNHDGGHFSKATMRAGNLAGIETRAINSHDHLCGNEETFYQPLAKMSHSMAAVAVLDQFKGPGLGVSWTLHGKRSAFVGTFDVNVEP